MTYSKLMTRENPKPMNYGSRNGHKIEYIVMHHNATTNAEVAMNTWVQGGAAGTSAHYEITPNETIGCVGEEWAAWHAGGTGGNDRPRIPNINYRSIGLEHLNSTGAASWQVAQATQERSAQLVADLCKRYGIPCDRQHVVKHSEVTATACPGGMNVDWIVNRAREIMHGKPSPKPTPPKPNNNPTTSGQHYPVSVGKTGSKGHLDRFGPLGDKLIVEGWHTFICDHEYIFIIDRVTGKELARKEVKPLHRPDVKKAFGLSYDEVGFKTEFDLKPFRGHSVIVMMRGTDNNKGEPSANWDDLTETRWYHDL